KRQRSRSQSLTPPPELTYTQKQNARQVVRDTLAPPLRRLESPTWEADESTDTIDLDPELARIAAAARSRVASQGSVSGEDSRALAIEQGGGPEKVAVCVRWTPHPLDTAGEPSVMEFNLGRHESFSSICNEVADDVGILVSSLVLMHNGVKVVPSATPHSLKFWAEGELDASDKNTHEYLRSHRNDGPAPTVSATPSGSQETHSSGTESEVEPPAEGDNGTFKLIIRAGGEIKDVTVTVRPTTTAGAIVRAFLKRAGLADKYPEGKSRRKSLVGGPGLIVDGSKMDPGAPIADADLEDGDMVEIKLS
ncbi:hypothetical protein K488DRAFT_40963, partial [Vararia minispora EC-137]